MYFEANETLASFSVGITAANRIQQGPRKGYDDDRRAVLTILSAWSEFGVAFVGAQSSASLDIRAVCQAVTDACEADFSYDGVAFFRTDGF